MKSAADLSESRSESESEQFLSSSVDLGARHNVIGFIN